MSMTIGGTSGLVFPDSSTQNTAATGFGFKNRIINGAMMIDQRNAGASVTPAAAAYTLDRWSATMSQASKFSVQQNAGSVTPPVGFTNYLGCTSVSAYSLLTTDTFGIIQRIEGFNVADLGWGTANAQTVTLSFWVRSSLTGTFGGSIRNGAADRSYPFSFSILSANTWEQKTITISGDTTGTWLTNNGTGLVIKFSLGAGATQSGTAGAWSAGNYDSATGATSVVGTNGATFYITGVQLEKGSTATSFDYRPYGTELQLCQRYCQAYSASVSSAWGVGSPGYYSDANTIIQSPLSWFNASILRDVSSASLSMVGTQGTDWSVTTSGSVNQTGFTLSLATGGNTITCSKTAHGLTASNTWLRIITTSGRAIVSSEL